MIIIIKLKYSKSTVTCRICVTVIWNIIKVLIILHKPILFLYIMFHTRIRNLLTVRLFTRLQYLTYCSTVYWNTVPYLLFYCLLEYSILLTVLLLLEYSILLSVLLFTRTQYLTYCSTVYWNTVSYLLFHCLLEYSTLLSVLLITRIQYLTYCSIV